MTDRPRRARTPLFRRVALALTIAGGVTAGAACRRQPPPALAPIASGGMRGSNVLLVTIDTLRADYVGAYGSARGLTPTLDEFAAAGLRFEHAYAHVPLTLPSHASLLTASYPTRNGVHDNGTFHLGTSTPTVAEALKRAGYRTAAFVGAFVLDARFGLGRGFDLYDDRVLGRGGDVEFVRRSAEQVLAPAAEWITRGGPESGGQGATNPPASSPSSSPSPWFVWVHLYDPHEPYEAPEPYRSRYAAAPYQGAVAYADAALGQFMNGLRRANALDNTLVVIAADHGESLGEHGERTHGLFAYDSTLRVPLVVWAPGRISAGLFTDTMRLVDVVPTLLDLVGVAPLAGADGRSIRPFATGEQPFDRQASYFEALNANLTRGWAPLTGVVRERFKVIDLPIPELYDLAVDPAEQHNVYAQQQPRARELEANLDRVVKGAAPATASPIDADAAARLRSLGYVVASPASPRKTYGAADDPKTLVHLNAALDAAAAAWAGGDARAAVQTLDGVIRERPDLLIAYERIGYILRVTGRPDEAVRILDRAARDGHADRGVLRSLGSALRDSGDLKRSVAVLSDLAKGDRSDLETADELGVTLASMGRSDEAEREFRRVLAASPNASETWNNLGSLFLATKHYHEAEESLSRATAINPNLAAAHNGLGVALAAQGKVDQAVVEWRRALELRPGYADAQYNLDRARQ